MVKFRIVFASYYQLSTDLKTTFGLFHSIPYIIAKKHNVIKMDTYKFRCLGVHFYYV